MKENETAKQEGQRGFKCRDNDLRPRLGARGFGSKIEHSINSIAINTTARQLTTGNIEAQHSTR